MKKSNAVSIAITSLALTALSLSGCNDEASFSVAPQETLSQGDQIYPPGEEPVDGDKPSDSPSPGPSGSPAPLPSGAPSPAPSDVPAEKPGDKPVEKPGDKPYEKPGDKPVEKPGDKPAEKPGDKPAEKPGDKPKGKPTDKPVDRSERDKEIEEEAPLVACKVPNSKKVLVCHVPAGNPAAKHTICISRQGASNGHGLDPANPAKPGAHGGDTLGECK